ncbi:MAG TPA: hypothetical protein VFB58_11375 [Chloroflexota bacterium]|nr:hypothetical protein [Chloroflexota bacterium]
MLHAIRSSRLVNGRAGRLIVAAGLVSIGLLSPVASHASTPTSVTFHAQPSLGTRVGTAHALPTGSAFTGGQTFNPVPFMTPWRGPHGVGKGIGAPSAGSLPLAPHRGAVLQQFNGLDNNAQAYQSGIVLTPPDQGVCAGYDPFLSGHPEVVFEVINEAGEEVTPGGKVLAGPFSLAALFNDPYTLGDVRCYYDATTQSFYFTEIGFNMTGPNPGSNSTVDIAVYNSNGLAEYQFDTSQSGAVFGDQPEIGYDNYNLYVATDQFPSSGYDNAELIAISKSDLVDEVASPQDAYFQNVSIGGLPMIALEPAVSPGVNTEYMLNSFSYDQNFNPISPATTLGFWRMNGEANLHTATLQGTLINSEAYAFPVPAASDGSGNAEYSVSGLPITAEAYLQPDDSRLLQVQVASDSSGLTMWAALDSAVTIPGDTTRDAAAWFEVDPTKVNFSSSTGAGILHQGYLAAAGQNLLYPAIWYQHGTVTVVYTDSSATMNPSAAYSAFTLGTKTPSIYILATGPSPHYSFCEYFGCSRWGDYSAATADPSGSGVWIATEYTAPESTDATNGDAYDNWGTYVAETRSS